MEPDVDIAVEILEMKIMRVIEKLAPEIGFQTRVNSAPWMNREILDLIKSRDQLLQTAKQSGTFEDWASYKRARNHVKHVSMWTRKQHAESSLNSPENSSKNMWDKVRGLTGLGKKKDQEQKMVLDTEDGELVEEEEVANYMNEYFRQKVVNLQNKLSPSVEKSQSYTREYLSDKPDPPSFGFQTVDFPMVASIISGLTNTGSVGRDGISTKVLKRFVYVLTPPITHVCNLSIMSSRYPRGWKHGLIKPLHKGSSRRIPKNWRPVVLLPNLSKILEKILNIQLVTHLEFNGLMSPVQNAYRKKRSCSTCWLEIDTRVADARNRGRHVCLLCTDQSAAFNLVKKDIMMAKLELLGVDKWSRDLLNSYLTGRTTQTRVGHVISDVTELQTGVGEGSILGPCMFITLLCDVTVVADRARVRLEAAGVDVAIALIGYADDVSALVDAKTEPEIQMGVDVLMEEFVAYFSAQGLSMNPDKSEVVMFRKGRVKEQDITVSGQIEAEKVKLLGVVVNTGYEFTSMAERVAGTVRDKTKKLSKILHLLRPKTRKMVMEAVVLSTITYCVEIWCQEEGPQHKVQVALNGALRAYLGIKESDRRHYSVEELLSQAEWLNMANQWRLGVVYAMKRLGTNRIPEYVYGFMSRAPRPVYGLRLVGMPLAWYPKTEAGRKAVIYQGSRILAESRIIFCTQFQDKRQYKAMVVENLIATYKNENI